MPTGPNGQKRPADAIGNAVKVMRIATGGERRTVEAAEPARRKRGQYKKRGVTIDDVPPSLWSGVSASFPVV
ncbi:hypothetical protein OFEAOIEE_LOCUS3197 [Methylorubrum extorquens]